MKKRPSRNAGLVRSLSRHRRVVPGAALLLTKKTNDDLFWLVPSRLVDQILLYLLLLKAKKYGILLHAFGFMSNHFHLVITDPRGEYPAFMREFLGESGKALKLARRTTRGIWSDERYSSVQLLDLDATEREIAYTLLNPMEAELTEPEEWPGLTSARHRFGDTITAERPKIYFSAKRPESVSVALASIVGEDATSEARIRELVEARCAEIRRDLGTRGRRLAGPANVMKMPCAKRTTHPIRNLNPRLATKNPHLLRQAIAELRQFEIDHEAAKRRYIAGHHRTLFPPGTYGYRVVLGVRVAKRRSAAA